MIFVSCHARLSRTQRSDKSKWAPVRFALVFVGPALPQLQAEPLVSLAGEKNKREGIRQAQ